MPPQSPWIVELQTTKKKKHVKGNHFILTNRYETQKSLSLSLSLSLLMIHGRGTRRSITHNHLDRLLDWLDSDLWQAHDCCRFEIVRNENVMVWAWWVSLSFWRGGGRVVAAVGLRRERRCSFTSRRAWEASPYQATATTTTMALLTWWRSRSLRATFPIEPSSTPSLSSLFFL